RNHMPETAIVPAPAPVALTRPIDEVQHAISVNLGGMQLSPFDFSRLTIPTGGGTQWMLETLEGSTAAATVEGVIIVARDVRSYWKTPYGADEKKPPDCFSR